MKIDTKKILVNLKGENLKNDKDEPVTVGDAIGNIIITSDIGGKMKMYVLAKKFVSEKEVDVDDADLLMIKDSIEKSKVYNALVCGQILQLIEASKKEPVKTEPETRAK